MGEDGYVPDELFSEFLSYMPQVSVELFLEKNNKALVARRNNKPAKDEWFWPGGRLNKGETFEEAVHRIASRELGIEVEIKDLLGVYNHFWDDGRFSNTSTHTVNIVYRVRQVDDSQIVLDDQHDDYQFVSGSEDIDFHEYVLSYLKDSGIFNE